MVKVCFFVCKNIGFCLLCIFVSFIISAHYDREAEQLMLTYVLVHGSTFIYLLSQKYCISYEKYKDSIRMVFQDSNCE